MFRKSLHPVVQQIVCKLSSGQGAGGVGGLLAVTDLSVDTDETYFPFYDGNGNATLLVDASEGKVVAEYDYGPFGEPVKAVGEAADKLDYRFSTKFTDDVTGIVHYELRPLDTQIGRWSTRDPIEEQGGLNLYGFVNNDPINQWDIFGLRSFNNCTKEQKHSLNRMSGEIINTLEIQRTFLENLSSHDLRDSYLRWTTKLNQRQQHEVILGLIEYVNTGIGSVKRLIKKINKNDVGFNCCVDKKTIGSDYALAGYENSNSMIMLVYPDFWDLSHEEMKVIVAHEFGHATFGPMHISDLSNYSYCPPDNLGILTRNADFSGDIVEIGSDRLLMLLSDQIKLHYSKPGPKRSNRR